MVVGGRQFLSKNELTALHEATVRVLEETGVRFSNRAALDVLRENGAKTEGDVAFMNEKLLTKLLSLVPKSFSLYGREKGDVAVVGGGEPVFAAASGPVFVKRSGVKRLADRKDFTNFMKLSQISRVLNLTNYIMIEPQDVEAERRKPFQIAAALKYSTKPLIGNTLGGNSARCFDLVRDFYGGLDKYRLLGILSPISPLVYDEQTL